MSSDATISLGRFKKTLLLAGLLSAGVAQAHYVWLERDAQGPARGYFGEWENEVIEKTGGSLDRIATPKAFMHDATQALTISRAADHLAIAVSAPGDVRLTDTVVNAQRKTRTSYYAKAGRTEQSAVMDLELVPSASDANVLTLMWQGAPLPKADVTIYGPPKWQQSLTTDDKGVVTIKTPWQGRYVLESIRTDPASTPEQTIRQIATLSFVVDKGIPWSNK